MTDIHNTVTKFIITPADIKKARKAYELNEPRNLFYRAATELVELALQSATSLTVSEALAVLLQTWNKAYYQYHKFDNAHFSNIEELLLRHHDILIEYRDRTIENLSSLEKTAVTELFQSFEVVLGPVGAAKALHLLAPGFFPLWDRAIAERYDLTIGKAGSNGDRYWRFMFIAQYQCRELKRKDPSYGNLLKSIDEHNYCKYTRKWL
jgi:hypothetical protein